MSGKRRALGLGFRVFRVDIVGGCTTSYLVGVPACCDALFWETKAPCRRQIGLRSIVFLVFGVNIFICLEIYDTVLCYLILLEKGECKQLGCGWCGTWVCYLHPHGPGLMDSVPHFSCEINHPNVYKTKIKFFLTFTWPNCYLLVVYVGPREQ